MKGLGWAKREIEKEENERKEEERAKKLIEKEGNERKEEGRRNKSRKK